MIPGLSEPNANRVPEDLEWGVVQSTHNESRKVPENEVAAWVDTRVFGKGGKERMAYLPADDAR